MHSAEAKKESRGAHAAEDFLIRHRRFRSLSIELPLCVSSMSVLPISARKSQQIASTSDLSVNRSISYTLAIEKPNIWKAGGEFIFPLVHPCFLHITIGDIPAGRIKMELFTDIAPTMAENFKQYKNFKNFR
ncbi:hypothetical protein L2E82_45471 [Cichorium intybus]|uniref:Uncharacterized protein n=1 Tax=Cichorium intybus TaxID=13427 RepID=A0ACB8ZSN9_CICIN|nr:hypothetical protein L2E82_45471 [Cichorium intybus]